MLFRSRLRQLDLQQNMIRDDGAKALGEGLKLNGSLTSLDVRDNKLGDAGWCAIFDALRDNPQNKIATWNLREQGINAIIAKSLAAYVAVSGSLNKVRSASANALPSELTDRCVTHSYTSPTTTFALRARRQLEIGRAHV